MNEEAAEFWDTHDTTDYPDAFRTVKVKAALRRRRYEIEIAPDVAEALQRQARRKKVAVSRLATDLLREHLD